MEKNHFDKWIETNAELSVIKEEAENLLAETANYDLSRDMQVCFNAVKVIKEDWSPMDEYHVRRAISQLAHSASIGKLTLASLLESHNTVDSKYAPSRIIMNGCATAIEKESTALNDLWKSVNT